MNMPSPARRPTWPARLVQLATVVVVTAIAAATFVLSYPGVHAIALQSGVSPELARFYPAIFDAVLVIACAATPLRTRWLTRSYTWLVIIVVIGLLGAMDAVHAMNVSFPRRQAAGTTAVLPWVLLLLAFTLWLAILRHFRAQHLTGDAPLLGTGPEAGPEAAQAGTDAPAPGAARAALPAASGPPADDPVPDADPAAELADPAGSSDELLDAARADGDAADEEPGDPALPPAEGAAELPVPEVPGITYATGPRLRRVRSLPAPPVDDSGGEGDGDGDGDGD
ncbi:MAG TPA: DUF2637 domain-containing protein [Trebonia sp.]|jgi:hypothetical protein|nr:DUF2637 domain-containing protein [Trebonia sp.]